MSLGYIVKEGFAGFKRARLASFTSIFSLFVAVLLLGILGRVFYNAYEVGQSLKSSIDVEVFLTDLDERTTRELEQELSDHEIVQQINYISKDSASAIFEEEFGEGSRSLAELNFLPASFRLEIDPETDAETVNQLVQQIEGYRGVDDVQFNRQLLELLQQRFTTVLLVGGGLGALVLLASVILVFNTIRLTIYSKRKLIKAMKLVGATNGFIRRPFVMEGVIQGCLAGLLAVGIMFLAFQYIIPLYVPQVGIMEWPFGRWYYLSGGMVLLAVTLGFMGSQWAARRFIQRTSISE